MSQIPEGAVARLTMVNGNLVSLAEIASILESFNYDEDPLNPERWNLRWEHPADADAALHILQDGEVIDVYSESPENMLNVNHIATRFGWADCELYSINSTIEQMLMSRTANLNVLTCITDDASGAEDERTAGMVELPEPLPLEDFPGDADLPTTDDFTPFDSPQMDEADLDAQLRQIQQLTLQLNDAQLRAAQFEDERNSAHQELTSLRNEVAALRAAGSMATTSETTATPSVGVARPTPQENEQSERGLLSVLEKHLSAILDLSNVTDAAVAKDLLALGYNIKVQLVRA